MHKGTGCNKCGQLRETAGTCINTTKCLSREKFLTKLVTKFPFNLKKLNFTLVDFYILLLRRNDLQNELKTFYPKNEDRIGLKDFLSLTASEAEFLFSLDL